MFIFIRKLNVVSKIGRKQVIKARLRGGKKIIVLRTQRRLNYIKN